MYNLDELFVDMSSIDPLSLHHQCLKVYSYSPTFFKNGTAVINLEMERAKAEW